MEDKENSGKLAWLLMNFWFVCWMFGVFCGLTLYELLITLGVK